MKENSCNTTEVRARRRLMDNRIQLTCDFGNQKTASFKAPNDVSSIADTLSFDRVVLRENGNNFISRYINRMRSISVAEKSIQSESIVLLQYPIYYKNHRLFSFIDNIKNIKKCKIITLFHDINSLRNNEDLFEKKVFERILRYTDVYIVHNDVMKEYLVGIGCSRDKIVSLEIFDYLFKETDFESTYSKSVTIAGNLDTNKAAYISQLDHIKSIKFNLYGVNFDEKLADAENINYFGSFSATEIPEKLNTGFGLVWDGNSIESCTGATGEYLKINNPHKLSLYLVSGIPVVIWKEAAEAEFVRKNKVGLCVASLKELENTMSTMTEGEYRIMLENVKVMQRRLSTGYYTKKALDEAISILNKVR